jgi:hypothetical protein
MLTGDPMNPVRLCNLRPRTRRIAWTEESDTGARVPVSPGYA